MAERLRRWPSGVTGLSPLVSDSGRLLDSARGDLPTFSFFFFSLDPKKMLPRFFITDFFFSFSCSFFSFACCFKCSGCFSLVAFVFVLSV